MPLTGTGSGVYNSDLAFKDNLVIAGTYEGFRILDFTDKTNPTEVINYTGCNVGQGDVIVYGNILVRSWDSPASAPSTCAGQLVGAGFEGIHVFNISNPAQPQYGARSSASPRTTRASSAAARTPRPPCRTPHVTTLYIYNGGSSGTCQGIDIFKIKISDPSRLATGRATNEGIDAQDGRPRAATTPATTTTFC